ncbi:MAG: nucleotidyltransferase domain-containing protein, partial [Methylotenera sp.]
MHSGNQYTEEYTSKESDKNNIAAWRQYLKDGFSAIKADFLKKPNNTHLFRQHCKLIDRLLITIWSKANIDESCCLIAVGGYGRGELYPYSDIDLLILLPDTVPDTEQSNSINNKLETLIGLLWDIGLNVGHSVRSLNECVDEAKKDITVQTNLLESRLLTGETNFYQSFLNRVNGTLEKPTDIANFFSAKLKEQNNRHYKFNDTAYNLEPNIKESPGGLRDIHMILWVAQCLNMGGSRLTTSSNTWALLTKQNIITPLEARQIQQHQRNLQLLRIRLHFLSNRREDRLLFDFQNELADSLGYVNTPRKRASEQMMQSYYRSV